MLSVKQAAALVGVSERTIRNRIYSDEIRAIKKDGKFGPTYFIPESEVRRSAAQEAEAWPGAVRPPETHGRQSPEGAAASDVASVVIELAEQVREQAEQIGRFKAIAERSEAIEQTAEAMRVERDRIAQEKYGLELRVAELTRESEARERLSEELQEAHARLRELETTPRRRWFSTAPRKERTPA